MAESEHDEMAPEILKRVLKLVHQHTGITMSESRKTMLQGRLRRRLRELSLPNYADYVRFLESNPQETQPFINLVTTNETSFFRTPRVWDFLRKEFLPTCDAFKEKRPLKIWSAASSTGEEVYTLGICCQEFKNLHPDFNFQITGTDIDTSVLATATKGEYQGRSIENFRNLQRALFDKYMNPVGDMFRVNDDLRNKIRFTKHNLFESPPAKDHYDLVFLRNVLIYFEPVDQEKVLRNMQSALNSTGLLVIGESESLSRLKTGFQFKAPLIYERTAS